MRKSRKLKAIIIAAVQRKGDQEMMVAAALRRYRTGIFYAYIHFVFEISAFYILTQYVSGPKAYILALLYDFYAFVPQGLIGYVMDAGFRIPLLALGTAFTAAALGLTAVSAPGALVVMVISIGSVLIHVSGAERTLRDFPGEMTPSALFVSGGSFGLITGRILAMYECPVWIVLLIALTILIPGSILRHMESEWQIPADSNTAASSVREVQNLSLYHFASPRLPAAVVVILAVFVVAVRAYMGYGIPTAWRKTLLQTVMLYVFMGSGKALGGVLIDRIGIRRTSLISTLCAAPFLIAGDKIMGVSLIGILLFSMTMAVTLAIIVSRMPRYPGIAFGMTTVGLFLGTWIVFFTRLPAGAAGTALIIGLTVLCYLILRLITPDSRVSDTDHP